MVGPACVEHGKAFGGFQHRLRRQLHASVSGEYVPIGLANGVASERGSVAGNEQGISFIESHEGLDVGAVEGIEKESVNVLRFQCWHNRLSSLEHVVPAWGRRRPRRHPANLSPTFRDELSGDRSLTKASTYGDSQTGSRGRIVESLRSPHTVAIRQDLLNRPPKLRRLAGRVHLPSTGWVLPDLCTAVGRASSRCRDSPTIADGSRSRAPFPCASR